MTDIIEFLYQIASAPWWVYLMLFAWFCWAVYYNKNRGSDEPRFLDQNGNILQPKDINAFFADQSDRRETNGMLSLSEAPGETGGIEKESSGENSGVEEGMEVEASGDALVIADAIAGHAGAIHDLADAIRGYARVMAVENGVDDGPEMDEVYLDGTRK